MILVAIFPPNSSEDQKKDACRSLVEYSGENWQIIRHTFFERPECLFLAGRGGEGAEFLLGGRVPLPLKYWLYCLIFKLL